MSEPTDEATTEATEANEEPTESTETEQNNAPDEQPPIEEGEMADLDLGVDPEEVEEQAGAGGDDTDGQDAPDDEPVSMSDAEAGGSSGSYGEMYVTGLATTATAIKKEKGSGGTADKELAYEIGLDEHFDEWLRQQGLGEDMPPGQAVMIGTLMYLFAECATDEELLGNAMEAIRA